MSSRVVSLRPFLLNTFLRFCLECQLCESQLHGLLSHISPVPGMVPSAHQRSIYSHMTLHDRDTQEKGMAGQLHCCGNSKQRYLMPSGDGSLWEGHPVESAVICYKSVLETE